MLGKAQPGAFVVVVMWKLLRTTALETFKWSLKGWIGPAWLLVRFFGNNFCLVCVCLYSVSAHPLSLVLFMLCLGSVEPQAWHAGQSRKCSHPVCFWILLELKEALRHILEPCKVPNLLAYAQGRNCSSSSYAVSVQVSLQIHWNNNSGAFLPTSALQPCSWTCAGRGVILETWNDINWSEKPAWC